MHVETIRTMWHNEKVENQSGALLLRLWIVNVNQAPWKYTRMPNKI